MHGDSGQVHIDMKITAFARFSAQFEKSFKDNPRVIRSVLANIFSMRIIGNKTHGDLAEIALTEYISQFVGGYSARHTGKEKFRAKEFEEDIRVKDLQSGEEIPVSIKTYGFGPLQLSTNKDSSMFSFLRKTVGGGEIRDVQQIKKILGNPCFADFNGVNVLPLIYNERAMAFKVIVFDLVKAYSSVRCIRFLPPRDFGSNRQTFPIYKFYDADGGYVFEVRYGDAKANALQRGMWTHTENAHKYFRELLSGEYGINQPLINLLSKILVSPKEKHEEILKLFF
ncbi:MAG: hypothetical protein A3H88_01615 [Candidatus Blackburnbacteria bacterium RIFCSPLOWO2_02_FULL_44_9]|uniref:Uncharacterized protein n=1 Tax=Candidatus Blackburnbacteria bacterium RIFCSPHIGHO2_02_FULL_44_20 TaxID=1797516 RepID=A0A1G1V6S3_9BACT|nr:MAG: hypothetical protein A3D26_04465 [Candidatus Blackburnbacteria bacterium RIFCSPHIGHO2_02_FULL_44_20]OGY11010.1 MAG: hypothetical protein A3E16_01215 [Candidatus Blackburnbacteria bacterium RIFCSPHIGHO2_12_FULL_44_25]OGY15511.1 MAG: hypothetical protein A3H88_01615 [Candidatus Blackburnbacteria bacterium RIFCSPLOWO2_02_FULL_44_9]